MVGYYRVLWDSYIYIYMPKHHTLLENQVPPGCTEIFMMHVKVNSVFKSTC